MGNITERSLGELMDKLSITNILCFMAQEKIMDGSLPASERLDAAIKAQKANAKRSQLIKAIDETYSGGSEDLDKTYG